MLKISHLYFLLIVVLIWFGLSPSSASAENLAFQWSARFSVSQQYDTNINLTSEDEEDDWITSAGPGFTLSLLTEETDVNLNYDIRAVMYANNDSNNSIRHSLTLTGLKGIPIAEKVTLDVIQSFIVSEDPIEVSQYVNSERRGRDRYLRNTSGFRLNYHFGEDDVLYGGFNWIYLWNEDPTVQDSQRFRPSAGISYWFDIRNGVSLDYAFTRGIFDEPEVIGPENINDSADFDQHAATITYTHRFNPRTRTNLSYAFDTFKYDSGIRDDYKVHTVRLRLGHDFTEDISGSISAGVFRRNPEGSSSTTRFTGDGSLDGRFRFEKGSFGVGISSGYRQQLFVAENLGFSRYYSARADFIYSLTEKLGSSLAAFYSRDEYLEAVPERDVNRWGASASLNYPFLRWLSASLRYNYHQRHSTISGDDFTDHRVTFNLVAFYVGEPKPF